MTDASQPSLLRLRLAVAVSLALLLLRLVLAKSVGFADAEALYACYAMHPQPAYIDHPGLVGMVMGLIGGNSAPDPAAAHRVSACLATLVPWLGALAARASGASGLGSLRTFFALALAPEIAIGLFALTPDLLLALLWLGALGCAAFALRAPPGTGRALFATLGAAAFLGLATLAKVSAVLLGIAFAVTLGTRAARAHLRTPAPWVALALYGILVAPVVHWEASHGYPMLVHRLIATQSGAGFSLRNLGALVGGQLLYVSPPMLFAAGILARSLFDHRSADTTSTLLWNATWIPGIALSILCLWSRVAEPHWLAPAYLALALSLAHDNPIRLRLAVVSLGTGAVLCLVAFGWVSTTLPQKLLGDAYRARYDLANDLYAWGPGRQLVLEAVQDVLEETKQIPVVVGPHYIVCAQAHAALGPSVPVGCNGPERDDFDDWLPRQRWLDAKVVLYVQDERFGNKAESQLPNRVVRGVSTASVRRGDVVVRTLHVTRLDKLSETAALPR